MDKNNLVAIRDWTPEDKNFILSTWLKGLRFGNDWFELIDSNVYYKNYHAVIESLLNSPGIVVKVACLKDDPEVILGYGVYKGERLDWIFVKKAWRSIGIARSLIPSNITTVSHITDAGRGILRKHPGVTFNPFFT